MLKRLRDLAHTKDGYTLALITKADLADLICQLDQCVSTGGGDLLQIALERNVQLRNELSAVSGHSRKLLDDNQVLAKIVKTKDYEARSHGEERRRYMGNNKALLARVEQLEWTVGEMGEIIDDQDKEITGVNKALRDLSRDYGVEMGARMLAESKLTIIRRAAE